MDEGNPKEIVDLYKKLLVHIEDGGEGTEGENEQEALSPEEQEKRAMETGGLTGGLPKNPNTLEYGEGHASIVYVATMDAAGNVTSSIEKGTEFSIRMRVKFNKDVSEPIFSFINFDSIE